MVLPLINPSGAPTSRLFSQTDKGANGNVAQDSELVAALQFTK